jgi:uncharacterized membrane protein
MRSFDVTVTLAKEYDFEVEERIRWDFEGAQKHGIFRTIPLRYARPPAPDYRIEVDVQSVTDENGVPYPWKESSRGGVLDLRIGDPNITVTGQREYVIRYRVGRALLYFPEHDELYWNATGNDWPVPIESVRASVTLPAGTTASVARRACFAGPAGSRLAACTASDEGDTVRFEATQTLQPGSGLTLVVGLPKGFLPEPSALRQFLLRASDFLSVWLLAPIGAFAFMLRKWRSQGRDPVSAVALPVRYEPPEGLTPAEVGTVVDESADTLDLTATILDLAVRGFLVIEEVETTKFLFLSNRDYRLQRTDLAETSLKTHERLLLAALFSSGKAVLTSDLKDKFYANVPGITQALYKEVSGDQGFFPSAPDRVRTNYRTAGVALLVLGPVGGIIQESMLAIVCGVLAGVIVLGFARHMPRRTPAGRKACDDILGFREFVTRVDQDRLERMGGKTAARFEQVLPYAIVLGVADQWATAFAGIYTEPPNWYRSTRYQDGFVPTRFVSDVGQSLSTLGDSLTSRPASKGGGSGSSGFSGGSSGGGFGGGGGGSW